MSPVSDRNPPSVSCKILPETGSMEQDDAFLRRLDLFGDMVEQLRLDAETDEDRFRLQCTARMAWTSTISPERRALFYNILSEFQRRSGVGCV